MGACMDPPNRAIVTELVTRGSLWEVLRTPNLFNNNANANVNANVSHRSHCATTEDSPVDGVFFWPRWAVRRVLDDTCRGLVYLHSFDPPIIHRGMWIPASAAVTQPTSNAMQCIKSLIITFSLIPPQTAITFLSIVRFEKCESLA